MNGVIDIVNATALRPRDLEPIRRAVEEEFQMPTTLSCEPLAMENAYDESRAQYCSTALIALLLGRRREPGVRQIAIVDVDLFVPVLSFVFGEAQFGGDTAVVSTFRLSNEYYGIPPHAETHRARLAKELVHEIGHLFGLYHCRRFDCVMRSSTYAEEIDLKNATMCRECRDHLLHIPRSSTSEKAEFYERPIQSSM